ncbi:flavin-containing monooxygenase [Pseudomonas fluorescens]|uniref:flavin-containing monooxygenase n=1 Tax=Pseudomonas fluorescens TaxID=294 RepID=UPI00069ADC95|nr:NAD(P)/FAD-dependent oxidoreductase [Pseudomonas fluorescens]
MNSQQNSGEKIYEYAIIGTGFSGLGMAINLKKTGRNDFVVLEKASDVGGCWRDNTYPGCGCDIPSHLYSFSFEQIPDWTRKYPPQKEIHEYLRNCATKHGINSHIRFNSTVQRLVYLDAERVWQVEIENGTVLLARFVMIGKGPLHVPSIPNLPGLQSFTGKVFHSSNWDHSYDLRGKKVASIGTGASAIQYIPKIAPLVSELTVFQRSPAWILPRPDSKISRTMQALFARYPALQNIYRKSLFWRHEIRLKAMKEGSFVNRIALKRATKLIEQQVTSAQKREKLTPSYVLGCKRILISNNFYPAMDRPNVDLIASGVSEVTEHCVVAADGTRKEVDAIIFGTGFEVTDAIVPPGFIIGPSGEDLGERWLKKGTTAFRGVSISGMPNLFFLVGPNSGLGHNSMVLMIEAQIRYILDCLDHMQKHGLKNLAVREQAAKEFTSHMQEYLKDSVWLAGCTSWYLDKNGANLALWPTSVATYQKLMKSVPHSSYIWTK